MPIGFTPLCLAKVQYPQGSAPPHVKPVGLFAHHKQNDVGLDLDWLAASDPRISWEGHEQAQRAR